MPVKLGRRLLWRVADLKAWVAAGMPPRSRWQADQYRREQRAYLGSLGNKSRRHGAGG